ncbi:major facilitator superfamily domain-containing protein 8-like [Clytia hemisphaerica]|uniref:Major facilitator superfamily (MFS) profile domain-containing protein n=1 Tax=Clytia hemisphaerica TaxID=252671 RepID=A0A7M5XDZ1_9CNID
MTLDYKSWEKRRKRTSKIFYFQSIALGMEYALTFVTLYVYLKDVIKTKHVDEFYSVISAIFILSQITMSLIFGHLFDKYRNLHTMFFVGNVLIIIGNILYTIPYSAWNLFAGRLISGGGGSLRAIMTSELTRSYPEEELLPQFSAMGMSFAMGFIIGPVINFVFIKADFKFLGIQIGYANGSGLILTFVFIFVLFLATFGVSDLSKEYDMKETRMHGVNKGDTSLADERFEETRLDDAKEKEGMPLVENNQNGSEEMMEKFGVLKTLAILFGSVDVVLILFFSLFFMHCMVCYDIWQPMASIDFLKWGILEINIINLGYGVTAAGIFLIVLFNPMSEKVLVYAAMVCVLCLGCIQVMYAVLKICRPGSTVSILLWIGYTLWFAIVIIMEEVFFINTMSRLIPSSIQAFSESVRLSFSRAGAVIGLLTAAFSFHYIHYVCAGYLVITGIVMVLLIWRRKRFQHPQVIELIALENL